MRPSRLAVTVTTITLLFAAPPDVSAQASGGARGHAAEGAPARAPRGAAADSAMIRAAALDYIEGWYGADAARMRRAVHAELAKRIHLRAPETGHGYVQRTGASALIAGTARGGGSDTPEAERRAEVEILDVFRGAASVRVGATDWVDYLHMVETADGWKILNVLWELREAPGRP